MQRLKFYMIKWFFGAPKTGGDRVFMEIYNSIKDVPEIEVILIEKFTFMRSPNKLTLLFNFIYNNLKKNLYISKLVREGFEVYAGSPVGTFEYQQPFPIVSGGIRGISEKIKQTFRTLIYKILQLGINNLRIVIYASQYAMENYRFKKKGLIEEIILPGMLFCTPEINFGNKEDLILTISRISREKNLEVLETILDGLSYTHYLLGFCDDLKYLERLKRKLTKTIIIPNATEEEKNDLLKRAKILLHTATYDTAPLVLSEAMANGVIPIAHKSGGSSEIVPMEFLYDDFLSAKKKVSYFLINYNRKIGEDLISMSKKFTVERFHQNIRESLLRYLKIK